MARMGLIQKYDFKIGEKKMRILKLLYFTYAVLRAGYYSSKNDTINTIVGCAHMIVAAIYIVNP